MSRWCATRALAMPTCFHGPHSDKPTIAVPTSFLVLPKRLVVERTHVWIGLCRRLGRHHDRKPGTSTAWAWLAERRILASGLAARR